MTQLSSKEFLEIFQKAVNELQIDIFDTLYADTFMFGSPKGVQVVKKEDFLKVLPKRTDFFKAVGLKETILKSYQEKKLNEYYCEVETIWTMRYEKDGKTIDNDTEATYILYTSKEGLRIVVQIDHQDLSERIKELGLLK